MLLRIVTIVTLAVVVAGSVQAAEVDQREKRQEKRINRGIKSGRLSPAEAGRLKSQEAGIDSEKDAMRAAHGGHLTPADRRALNHDENRVSRHIHRQKHDENGR